MKRIYLAAPLSAETRDGIEANRRSAAKWGVWISTTFCVAVSADWIWMTGELEETPENRAWGLECDKAHIERNDLIWMVGPSVSRGMAIEAQYGRARGAAPYNLTGLPMDKALIEAALAEQGCCPGCFASRDVCALYSLSEKKCCPDCTHGRRDG